MAISMCSKCLREGARILHFDHPQDEAWGWARDGHRRRRPQIGGFDYRARDRGRRHRPICRCSAPAPGPSCLRARSPTAIVLRDGVAIDTTLPDYRELDDLMEASRWT